MNNLIKKAVPGKNPFKEETQNKPIVSPSKPVQKAPGKIPPTQINTIQEQPQQSTPTTSNWKEIVQTNYQNIYDMQEEIINFHDDLANDKDFSATNTSTTETSTQPSNTAFLNFILNNYAQGNTTQHELNIPNAVKDFDNKKSPLASAKGKETYDLRKILDSIQAVGAHTNSGMTKPDGKWGAHTNDALNNIKVFASAMMNIEKELNLHSNKFTSNDLNSLNKLIPIKDTEINAQEKSSRAPQIKNLIVKLRDFFQDFKTTVFENNNFSQLISQESSFPSTINSNQEKQELLPVQKLINESEVQIDPNNKDYGTFENAPVYKDTKQNRWKYLNSTDNLLNSPKLKTQQEIDLYHQYAEGIVPKTVFYISRDLSPVFDKNNNAGVSLKDLSSLDSFKKFLNDKDIKVDNMPASLNNETILKAYNKIKSMLDNNQIYTGK